MGNNESGLSKHIETARKTNVLQYDNKKLNEIRPQMCIPGLRTLSLNDNEIQQLPQEIRNLTNLKVLSLRNNHIDTLADVFGPLHKLENIQLNMNTLHGLPPSFTNLKGLKQLNLSQNKFTNFPIAILKLNNLQFLDLSSNYITKIPDEIETLQVDELSLNQNRIMQISEKISRCQRLKTLRLDNNQLELDAIPVSLLKDSNVSLISLEGNKFDAKSLQSYDGYDQYTQRYTAIRRNKSNQLQQTVNSRDDNYQHALNIRRKRQINDDYDNIKDDNIADYVENNDIQEGYL
ncbi:unnamed protein product, partial [Didymodactylos carnosus]